MTRRGGQGRRLPPTPNKPSTLKLQSTNINFPKLNASPTRVCLLCRTFDCARKKLCNIFIVLQLHSTHNTPHSVQSLPHSREFLRGDHRDMYYRGERERYRERDYGHRYEFRDREREAYERERELERELERDYERFESKDPLVKAKLTRDDVFRMEHSVPLSYEQALSMGRTGRILGSPVLNGGYKSKGLHARHSDSDEEDWC